MPDLTPLGHFLRQRWEELGIQQAEFARRVGIRSSHVYLLKTGQRKPPLEAHARWARALECTSASARERLLELMRLGHCPREIQIRYEDMRARLQS